jgi:hypothetical protein
MGKTLLIEEDELVRVYKLIVELQPFFHQPLHYQKLEDVDRSATYIYPKLREACYHTVWKCLPQDVQQRFIDGEEET